MEQRTCSKCGNTKPATREFFTWRGPRKGRQGHFECCHDCNRKRALEHRQKNADEVRRKDRVRYQRDRDKRLAYMKGYADRNRDRIAEYKAAYFQANKDRRYEYIRQWNEANPDKVRQYAVEWKRRNPERDREMRRAIYERRKETAAAYHREHRKRFPEKYRARVRNRRARLRKAEGSHTATDVAKMMSAQKCKCWWCGSKLSKKYHVDHRIPLALGGSNGPGNLVISCAPCNQRKGAKMPWQIDNPRLI